jgi:hypothetical protein
MSLLLDDEQQRLEKTRRLLTEQLPNLRARYERADGEPTARSYEGDEGIRDILDDLLTVVGGLKYKRYFAYSSSSVKKLLYRAYPQFTKRRIASGIRTQVISLGSGGRLVGLDERRWLMKRGSAPTYTLMYGDRVAHISLGADGTSRGTVIVDPAIADTQRQIFTALWDSLPNP